MHDTASGSVPAHALTGYWQNFPNPAPFQTLGEVPSQYDIIAVAFATPDLTTPGAIDFFLDPSFPVTHNYTDADFRQDIADKQAAGKSVILSVGGQFGDIHITDSASAANFTASAFGILEEYNFDGIDIDIEASAGSFTKSALKKALVDLNDLFQASEGRPMVLTMAPQTLDMTAAAVGPTPPPTATPYFLTALALQDKGILTVVNTQYYNSGSMFGCDGNVYFQGTVDFLTALACVQMENGLDPTHVGLGLPTAMPAAPAGGYVDPSVVVDALQCLMTGGSSGTCGAFTPPASYPTLRGAMGWSTNWDLTNTPQNEWSSTVGGYIGSLPLPELTPIRTTTDGKFVRNGKGTYTLTVANTGDAPTDGSAVTLTSALSAGLRPVRLTGTGWNCTLARLSCTRRDILQPGTSYPPLRLTVKITKDARKKVANTVTVTGGGMTGTSTATTTTAVKKKHKPPHPHQNRPDRDQPDSHTQQRGF
ncbi:glycosyl hydrolase family 18 protein [Streptomyces sp. NPDC049910]|uniref:glycosyl hydrolase family 18 protein n=1 Tax=Streptomyces sp. NPDC049910 TaxID=3155278 RepID=UPI003442640B